MAENKRIILAVTNDLEGDQRVHKTSLFLAHEGWSVLVVGRLLKDSRPIKRPYSILRFRLLFNKGPLFYLFYNIRLLFFLLFARFNALTANDLDTLPAIFLASRIRRKPMVYDSHELFTEVPELMGRRFTKGIWSGIERMIFPNLKKVITVNQSIADIYSLKYGVPVSVVRNLPNLQKESSANIDLPATFKGYPLIIYQGAVNVGRGLEEVLRALPKVEQVKLVIAGGGDVLEDLKLLTNRLGVEDRVWFTGRLPFETLHGLSRYGTLGISLEQDMGLNYHFALPNKLFDYMQAGLPVLASDLPEIRRVVEEVGFGRLVNQFDPDFLAAIIHEMITDKDQLQIWQKAALDASPVYTWESEQEVLRSVYQDL